MRPSLRLFIGEDELNCTGRAAPEVSIELEEFTRILQDAIHWDRAWLRDLADERIKMSADLYELMMTYSRLRPGA